MIACAGWPSGRAVASSPNRSSVSVRLPDQPMGATERAPASWHTGWTITWSKMRFGPRASARKTALHWPSQRRPAIGHPLFDDRFVSAPWQGTARLLARHPHPSPPHDHARRPLAAAAAQLDATGQGDRQRIASLQNRHHYRRAYLVMVTITTASTDGLQAPSRGSQSPVFLRHLFLARQFSGNFSREGFEGKVNVRLGSS